ncbi:MAG TPA: TldD/PmbA family protein [Planctomycetota bacterium]|nr:TldD/PmbA family protein [Planctomycetota bacterium]
MPIVESEARRILGRALELGKPRADEVEAWIGGGTHALTRFAENTIHQNVLERTAELTVRAAIGKRTARAETNKLDEAGIRACIGNAVGLAKVAPEDPELLPVLAGAQAYAKVEALDPATAASTPDARADAVKAVVDACAAAGATAAGAFEVVDGSIGGYGEIGTVGLLTSKGTFAYHTGTYASFTVTVTAGEGSGWAHGESWRAKDLDPAALGKRALEKALASREAQDLEPGKYTVVLEPAAMAEFVAWYLGGAFSAQAVEEGRSPISGKLGQKIAGENVTIRSDVAALRGRPFDEEGTPTQKVVLVEKGVQQGLFHDRKTAQRAGVKPTGHAPRQPSGWGPQPRAIVLEGGTGTADDLVKTVERGVLVTRFWYTNTVDERQGIVTGMTRDGTFLIENGAVKHAVKNMRFNEALLPLLGRIERLGAAERIYGALVPPAVVREFNFSSGTKF